MLNRKDIKYPITFISHGVGEFRFLAPNVCYKGDEKSHQGIGHFIKQHNTWNPRNNPGGDYEYFYGNRYGDDVEAVIKSATANRESLTAAGGMCKVEDMPLGAKLTAVQLDDETWLEMTITPKRIEVDSEVVTFLLHSHYDPKNKKVRFAGEVSMMRGAMIRWSK